MAQEQGHAGPQDDESNIVSEFGAVEIDWPRSIGFYGGLGLAVAMEMVAPPIAIFIGLYPILKLLNRPRAPLAVRLVSQVLEGAAKPVGGDAEGTIRIKKQSLPSAADAKRALAPAAR